MIKNFLLYFMSCAIYSRNRLKGGLVTIISVSWSSLIHGLDLKSPLDENGAMIVRCVSVAFIL